MKCPTCKQDMSEPPHRGVNNKDCPQCGQGLSWRKAKSARTVRRKTARTTSASDAITKFTFTLERRARIWVLQEKSGGCRPATIYEVVLWKFLQRAAM
jgi:hypothetical protein